MKAREEEKTEGKEMNKESQVGKKQRKRNQEGEERMPTGCAHRMSRSFSIFAQLPETSESWS